MGVEGPGTMEFNKHSILWTQGPRRMGDIYEPMDLWT